MARDEISINLGILEKLLVLLLYLGYLKSNSNDFKIGIERQRP